MRSAYHEFITPIQVEYDISLLEDSSYLKGSYSDIEFCSDPMDVVKIIFLGAQGVGKTSIIQTFSTNELLSYWLEGSTLNPRSGTPLKVIKSIRMNHFNEEYVPSKAKHVYYSSVIFNEHVYQLKITDVPTISYFPANSFVEWTDFRFYGLRNANAYIFVFDLSNLDTFQYIRIIRDQIAESRDIKNVPILIIGNKQDLITNLHRTHFSYLSGNNHPKSTEVQKEKLKEIVSLIRKQWKCSYIDCSAKYNWKVVAVFKEIIKIIESIQPSRSATFGHREVTSLVIENMHGNMERTKCIIL